MKHEEAKRGSVLLPRRWVVDPKSPTLRSFAWMARFRTLVKDYERIPEVLLGLHLFACAIVLLKRLAPALGMMGSA